MSHRCLVVVSLAALWALGCEKPDSAAPEGATAATPAAAAPAAATPAAATPAAAHPAAADSAAAAATPTAATPTAADPAAAPAPGGIAGIAGIAAAPGAEQAAAQPAAATIPAEHFDLEKVHQALRAHTIADADDLERYINDRKNGVTRVDVDGDGKVDLVQVNEVRTEDAVLFEARAIPSRSRRVDDAVVIAIIRVRPERESRRIVVVSEYSDVVIHGPAHRHEYVEVVDFDDDGLIVLAPRQRFFLWLFTVERPIYESVVIYTIDRTLVRPTRVRVVEVGHHDCWPPGHCKHRHHKHKKHKHKKHKHKKHKHDHDHDHDEHD